MTDSLKTIRVICFGGAYLQPGARRFLAMLDAQPEVDLVAILCEGQGQSYVYRLGDLWRRRGWLAPVVLILEGTSIVLEFLRSPLEALNLRSAWRRVSRKVEWFPALNGPRAITRMHGLGPDLAVIYGGPLLKPEVFNLPRMGTLGIHHGRVPAYRGKKTTFWEIYHGESHAGITIQKVGAGIDTGEVVATALVEIGRRGYGSVWRDVERRGCHLFVQAVLDVHHGVSGPIPQDRASGSGKVFRQPGLWQLLSLRRHRRQALQGSRAR